MENRQITTMNIADYQGADYNPRFLSEEAKANLCDSIERLGFVLPIIVNEANHVIVAGHQRTKVAKILGIEKVPAFKVKAVRKSDEVLFNQLHNELENETRPLRLKKQIQKTGMCILSPELFDITKENTNARNVMGISNLILRYGNVFMTIVAGCEAIYYQDYLAACKKLKIQANCYVAPDDKVADFKECFSKSYGIYDYSHLKKSTWVQGKAQLPRTAVEHVKDASKKRKASQTYERMVLKNENLPTSRILDFGCGRAEYIETLKEKGYSAFGIEFYNYTNHGSLNIMKTLKQINAVVYDVEKNGQFDIVVCDSVLNSVDCPEAEAAVMETLVAFCKTGGTLYFSGRSIEGEKFFRNSAHTLSEVHFIDQNGFTGHLRLGEWYFQRFHSKNEVIQIVEKYKMQLVKLEHDKNVWRVHAVKRGNLPTKELLHGLNYEFSLPYPGGRYNKAAQIIKALGLGPEK